MIVIVGGTSSLGVNVTPLLLARAHTVRVMTRDPARATSLAACGAEIVRGDLRDVDSVRNAVRGARVVISSSHAMIGGRQNSSAIVDDAGQRALIAVARECGVSHFIYVSAKGAAADHPLDFFRTKHRIETLLRESGLTYTILQPSAFLELHAYALIGKSVLQGKRVAMFGPGTNRKNFMATRDVAQFIVRSLDDTAMHNSTIELGGPEDLSSHDVVRVFERLSGKTATVMHVPLWLLRILAPVIKPFHGGVSRVLRGAILAEQTDQTCDAAGVAQKYSVRLTTLEEWARAHCELPRTPDSPLRRSAAAT